MSIVLNSDQIEATDKLSEFLNSDHKYFLLMGSAGTGKTSVIVEFLSEHTKKKIAFSATTNKAVSVLEDMMNTKLRATNNKKLRKSINFLTIHKLLKIKRKIDLEGNEIFVTTIDEENPLHRLDSKSIYSYDIIVIDEVSMMSMGLIEKLLKIKHKLDGKIIFVGDSAQLPPVNEDNSCVFSLKIPKYQLSNIVRSDGNMVILSNQVRNLVLKNGNVNLNKLKDQNLKVYRNKEDWTNKYISQVSKIFKKIKKGKTINEIKMPIVLTYTNKKCDEINKKVRNVLFNNPKDKYVPGDIIVFNNFYYIPSNKVKYYTSQQSYIKSVAMDEYHIKNLKPIDIINIRKNIKDLTFDAEDVLDKYDGAEDICNICLDKKELRKTKCEHLFCNKCFKAWFSISETCPLCRMDFRKMKMSFNGDDELTKLVDNLRKFSTNKKYKIWLITNGDDDTILCIHEDSKEQHQKDLENIKQLLLKIKRHIDKKYKHDMAFMSSLLTRLWDFYYFQFLDQFADIVYGYAITTHKSQGSTYKNVYIDMSDIISSNPNDKNSHQCLYTAITRASDKIKIYY
jgi:exodeoxyribonuclease V